MKRRTLAILLSFCMLFSLVACSGNNSSNGDGNNGGSTTDSGDGEHAYGWEFTREGALATMPQYDVVEGIDYGDYSTSNKLQMKIATFGSGDDLQSLAAFKLAQALEQKSGGIIELTVYQDGVMGYDQEILDNVVSGVLDFGVNNCSIMTNYVPDYNVLDLAYLFYTYDECYEFLDSTYVDEITEMLAPTGAWCWGLGLAGFRNVNNTKHEVKCVEDMDGIVIRVIQSEQLLKCFEAFPYGSPVAMAGSEILPGLQQGTIDAQENCPNLTYTGGHHEFAKYYSETEHAAQFYGFTVSQKNIGALSESLQAMIKETCEEVLLDHSKTMPDLQDYYLDLMIQDGVTVTYAEDVDKDSFRECLGEVYQEYIDEYGDYFYNGICEITGRNLLEE